MVIVINGDIVENYYYAVENIGHRIHKFTLRGEFLCNYGSKGSDNGQLLYSRGICINHKCVLNIKSP